MPSLMVDDGSFVSSEGTLPRDDREHALAWFGQAQQGVEASAALASFEEADSLRGSLRALVDPKPRRNVGSPWQRQTPSDQDMTPEALAEIAATVRELQQSAAEVLSTALDARIDREGQVTFSLAGVEGFRLDPRGGEVSFGHGDSSVSIVRYNAAPDDHQLEHALRRSQNPSPAAAQPSFGQEIIEFLEVVFQYPLFWLVILLLVIGKIALIVATRRSRRRMHRRRSSRPQVKIKLKLKRRRTRSRSRLARLPPTPSFQKP
jgi:hypothetical protein